MNVSLFGFKVFNRCNQGTMRSDCIRKDTKSIMTGVLTRRDPERKTDRDAWTEHDVKTESEI